MLFNTKVLHPSAAVSAAGNSSTLECLQTTKLAVQCVYTVTTGSYTLQLQESIDGTNWHDISGATTAVTSTGKAIYKVTDAVSLYYRVNIAKTSGDINALVITAHTKGV